MNRIKLFVLISMLFLVEKGVAQEFKLGKISIAELEQKKHPKDTAAVAAILYKKGTSQIEYDEKEGFLLTTVVEERIKIYKKEGYYWANQSVLCYNFINASKEIVSFSDATTYNLVAGKIEKTKLKSDGVFDEKVNKYYGRKKITMPNVKEGSILEIRYSIRTHNIGMMPEWVFQYEIPVNYSEYTTFIPEYYTFNTRQKGYVFPVITTETVPKVIITTSQNNEKTTEQKLDYVETRTKYVAQNLPAMKEESFVNNIDNYTSSLKQELATVQFPNKGLQSFSTDWNSVVKTIYDYNDFGLELNKTGYFEDDLDILLKGVTVPEEKILLILNFVKSKVKWNGSYGYNCDEGVRTAYKQSIGNVAEINLMLTAMLRYAGFTANPVLVSTRSNGIALFPNRTAFNYVIAAVETPNGNILLDATNKYSSPNILPFRVLNWKGRLIRKDGTSEFVDLMPKAVSNDNVFINYTVDTEGKITGKVRRQYTDYDAMQYRNEIDAVKEDAYLEKLENENEKIEISEYSRTNEKEILLPAVETFSFKGDNLSEIIGGKIYINPMLFFADQKNPFKQENREYPVDFGFPFSEKYNINIEIPEGFTVETLPSPAKVTMEDNLGAFKFNIVTNGNVLQLSILNQINEAIVSTEQYEMLKEYYKGMIAKETEKIVLKRI
jgi:hypothetical protein